MTLENSFRINEITLTSNKSVRINFTAPQAIKKYFLENSFFVSYNTNIEYVPKSILVIPFLSNVLPVAWATGVDIVVDEIDADFNDSVYDLKSAFKQMYPNLIKDKSNIISNKVVNNKKAILNRTSQLFSGGLDSTATLIRKIDERPLLITVWGADVKLNDLESWKQVKDHNIRIAQNFNTEVLFVKSNFKDFLNHIELGNDFGKIVNGWWTGVQHGLGLCGLSAPLSYVKGVHTFYIASSHTSDYKLPYGSHPTIDNKIKWGSTRVVHDAYELTRQQKLKVIANFIREGHNSFLIRVCWRIGSQGGNCSKCEKCSRTIVGLLLEELDPNRHGFKIDITFPSFVRQQFERKKWKLDEAVVFQWKDIQGHVPSTRSNKQYDEFFMWLKTFNFKKYELSKLLKFGITLGKILPTNPKRQIKKIIGME